MTAHDRAFLRALAVAAMAAALTLALALPADAPEHHDDGVWTPATVAPPVTTGFDL